MMGSHSLRYLPLLLVWTLVASVQAQEIPTLLTDKISQGSGTINLLTDVSSGQLSSYLEQGTLYLGVDLNENASGNESRDSVGVAIESMELVIQSTSGEVSFSDFYTNTTAMIQAKGSTESAEYYTMFGTLGSSQINGSSSGFDISAFDDVVEVRNIALDGEILSAELRVTFLDTANAGANEEFFDFSNGFEDFAIFTAQDAAILDQASVGIGSATPEAISYTQYQNINSAAGAPSPALFVLLVIPLVIVMRRRRAQA